MTSDQVEQFDLLPNPTKLSDSRSPAYEARFGNECWELDAIPPDDLVRIVQEAIEEERTDLDAWEEVANQDKRERKELAALFTELKTKYGKGA